MWKVSSKILYSGKILKTSTHYENKRKMNYPIKTKRKRAAVNRAPLDDGDNMPNIANAIVINIIYN